MIKIIKENDLKDLNYEEILNTVVDTIKSSEIEIDNENISSSDDIIELNANIRQINCDWTYRLYCCYKLNNDNVDYEVYVNLIEAKEELRPSDAAELFNLLQDIEDILNV